MLRFLSFQHHFINPIALEFNFKESKREDKMKFCAKNYEILCNRIAFNYIYIKFSRGQKTPFKDKNKHKYIRHEILYTIAYKNVFKIEIYR